MQGRVKFFYYVSLAISTITGGFIAYHSLDLVLLLSVIPLLCCFLVAFRFTDVPRHEVGQPAHYWRHFNTAWREVGSNRTVRYLFIYQVFCLSIFGDMEEYDQLYYKMVGLPLYAFGIVGFAISGLASLGSLIAYRLKQLISLEYLLPFITGLMILSAGLFPSLCMILVLVLSYFIISPIEVLVESRIQHAISAPSRATVTSMGKFFTNLTGIVITLAFGVISKIWNLSEGYMFFGITLIIFSLWVLSRTKTPVSYTHLTLPTN